jgi:hypothetical protein
VAARTRINTADIYLIINSETGETEAYASVMVQARFCR